MNKKFRTEGVNLMIGSIKLIKMREKMKKNNQTIYM